MGVFWMSSIKKCHAHAKGAFGYGSGLGQFSKNYNNKKVMGATWPSFSNKPNNTNKGNVWLWGLVCHIKGHANDN